MPPTPALAFTHRRRPRLSLWLGAVLLVAAGLALAGHLAPSSALPTTPSTTASARQGTPASTPPTSETVVAQPHRPLSVKGGSHQVGRADGEVPDGVTVHDSGYPAVARLDPALLGALREAADDAADDGVRFSVTSGWRSHDYQSQLFREAVSQYGSKAQAARWVAPPGTSAHESGQAVDLGPADAVSWLAQHGAGYGLCQVYDNEAWHFEYRAKAITKGCPHRYADPTDDPRLRG